MKAVLNDMTLAYDDKGSGPAVLLIHGFSLCRRMWDPQVEALTGAGYRVIAPDLRGSGESSVPDGPFSIPVMGDDVVGLMDHLNIEKAAVCGMSMGGYVLFDLLGRHPGRVSAASFAVTRPDADDETAKALRTKLAHAVQEEGAGEVAQAYLGKLFAEKTLHGRPDLVREVESWMLAADPRGLAGALLAMRERRDYTELLGTLKIPTQVISGLEDRLISPERSEIIHRQIPGSILCPITEAGHMANLEQPETFNRCLLGFLNKVLEK